MLRKYSILYTFASVCFAQTVFGQAGYVPGKVITAKGDTAAVFVKDQNDKSGSSACLVRTSAKSETTTYRPGEIRGYLLDNGERYESRSIAAADGSSDSLRVFLKQLVVGELTLYHWRGRERADRYFVADSSGALLELQGEQIRRINGRTYTVPGTYKNNLAGLMTKCPPKQEKLEELKLTASRMTALVGDYNRCPSVNSLRYEYQPARPLAYWVFRAGGGVASLNFSGGGIFLIENVRTSMLPVIAAGRKVQIPDIDKRLYFQMELQASSMRIRNQTVKAGKNNLARDITIRRATNYFIQMPVSLSYDLLPGNFTPYLYLGGALTLNILTELEDDWEFLDETSMNRALLPQLLGGAGLKVKQVDREYALDYWYQRIPLHGNAAFYTTFVQSHVLSFSVALQQRRK